MKITYNGVEYMPIKDYAEMVGTKPDWLKQKKNRSHSIPTLKYGNAIFIPRFCENFTKRHKIIEKYDTLKPTHIEIDGEVYVSSVDAANIVGCTRSTLERRGYTRIKFSNSYFYPLKEISR